MRHPYRPHLRAKIRRPPPECEPLTRRPYRYNADRTREADESLIDGAVAKLMEHFESVQVVVTRSANDGTRFIARGRGNWYARVGSVRDWLKQDDEETRVRVRQGEVADDGDDDELPASA